MKSEFNVSIFGQSIAQSNWRFALLLSFMAVILGCGDGRPARVNVSGQVLIDGKPLTVGNVKFVPEGARPSSGAIDSNGNFTLTCYDGGDGVVPGTHRVQVSAMEVISASKVRWMAPPKYADFLTSELSYEITEPTDDLKIELTWDGGKPFVQ
ncbi:hypothetical protein [Bythopirellula polymerisocia]|uniref:Carboxypeptidase regulatory-like domain-containing protein n=1 Tax=Bythopirellula polymerisocia TaxID=2528003 RepID=A0A5C6CMK6_9BACT|nr:hypothetical protein [Bythopirellula polymerisocia]TWU24561.1 hypothetical protein Pla144_34450 [Bythopirellula polymerisocia]